MDGGREKVVRREGCTREEKGTQQALPEEVAGSNLCLKLVAKWKLAALFLPALLPAATLSLLWLRVWSTAEDNSRPGIRWSAPTLSAWEVVSESPCLWPGHLRHRASRLPL